ncbi:MAG: cupin domain-containing protein [bacterium]|nr:MAG: cupin domain-containing protein [bacterium]
MILLNAIFKIGLFTDKNELEWIMICRYYKDGQRLDVAGLNEIIVLIDRSETELTEVALNQWRAELHGPPHAHEEKEQIFYITSGKGIVTLGKENYEVKPGNFIYVPAGMVHQTITTSKEPLCYILFNAFLSTRKEGHASFADHIEKVKNIRKQQAESGEADIEDVGGKFFSKREGKHIDNISNGRQFDFGSNLTLLLLDRTETQRCEVVVVSWPAGNKGAMVAHKDKEQTFFVLSGTGDVTVGNETESIKPGDIVFVPRNTPHTTEAAKEELTYLCLNTLITEQLDSSFEEMHKRVAPNRIARWKSGSSLIGE